jgi:uncharacterized membrane protein
MGKVEQMRAFREARYAAKQKASSTGVRAQQNRREGEDISSSAAPTAKTVNASKESTPAVTALLPAAGKPIQQYSDEQILAVVHHVVKESGSSAPDFVISESMRYLGFHRRGKVITERIQRALSDLSPAAEAG